MTIYAPQGYNSATYAPPLYVYATTLNIGGTTHTRHGHTLAKKIRDAITVNIRHVTDGYEMIHWAAAVCVGSLGWLLNVEMRRQAPALRRQALRHITYEAPRQYAGIDAIDTLH